MHIGCKQNNSEFIVGLGLLPALPHHAPPPPSKSKWALTLLGPPALVGWGKKLEGGHEQIMLGIRAGLMSWLCLHRRIMCLPIPV